MASFQCLLRTGWHSGRPLLCPARVTAQQLGRQTHTQPLVKILWRGSWLNRTNLVSVRSQFPKSRKIFPSLLRGRQALLPCLSLFGWIQNGRTTESLSADVLANIPKEVFRKESVKQKKKRNILMRVLLKIWKVLYFVLRFSRIILTFTPIILLYPVTYLGQPVTRLWWRWLLFAMEWTGPTFIKLGQWASTRRDLFPAEFCDLFSRLHHTTRVHAWHLTKRKLQKAFGKNWRTILVRIHRKPIGSGCIAQVLCTRW